MTTVSWFSFKWIIILWWRWLSNAGHSARIAEALSLLWL
jgi:hypothetical protein